MVNLVYVEFIFSNEFDNIDLVKPFKNTMYHCKKEINDD